MGQGLRTGLGHGGITCVLQTQFSSSKTIAAYNLEVGRYIKLNDLMKLHKFQRSRSLFGICQRSLRL